MSKLPQPVRSRRPSLPLVWIVPLVALAIGGWMVFQEYRQRGPEITLEFADGSGLDPGKTELEYKGVSVGKVSTVQLHPDLTGVDVRLRLNKDAVSLAQTGAQFWVVRPEVGFSGVRSLDALITGARLNVRPGHGPATTHFVGLDKPPAPEPASEGRAFMMQSDKLGSLTWGAPVFYREVKVGAVEMSHLSPDSTSVMIQIRIEPAYIDLVRSNTRFWNAGGFSFKVGLFGAELKNTSLESLVTGGISFATPDQEPLAAVAAENATFKLAAEPEKEWTKWQPRIPLHEVTPSSPMPPLKAANLPALMNR